MNNNEQLQKSVQDAIKWEPLLHAAQIGVIVEDGIVTLTGTVDSYTKKVEAENAAKRVKGVKVLVVKIEVEIYKSWDKKSDVDVAAEIINVFKWDWKFPHEQIRVKVEKGHVTLEGHLEWNYQKEAAENAIKNLVGIIGVSNNIEIRANSFDELEKSVIEHHLKQNWALNTDDISVEVEGTTVALYGTVASLFQKEEAARIVWNSPGIWTLHNNIRVLDNLVMA